MKCVLSDAVMDLTMTSNGATSAHHFRLSCVSGECDTDGIQLSITKDNSIVLRADSPHFDVQRPQTKEVVATGFTGFDHSGIFYCHSKRGSDQPGSVTLINNYSKGSNYYYMTPIADVQNRTAVLDLMKVDESHTGIYSVSYVGDSALYSAWIRLIVRECPKNKWGSDCDKDCPECLNGGVCHDKNGDCVCPPGFMGMRCETACREGMFGRNCQESCKSENGCQGLSFCLTDPYGCSCASGWHGDHCRKPCLEGMYGADCLLSCNCKNKGKCNRFSGCQCPTGWRGQYCEKSDRAPEILDMASNLEGNLNSSHKITCSATGYPLPSHMSIELRKLESIVLKASHTTMDSKKSTAHFEIPRLSAEHNGLWECRVSTYGGQDSFKFILTVKEPPYPTTAPKLLSRSSKQLVVKPVDTYVGDGPIVSTKLLYKPVDTEDSWSSIIVYGSDQITLPNLKPSTRYHVRVQLARQGEGGEGPLGPEAIMETDCPDPRRVHNPREAHHSRASRYCHSPVVRFHCSKRHSTKTTWL
uniref:Tyrosine kinase with immunoglobulin-like and EGF-like domains 1 n=1 Tax=Sinocyclocheilus grahami TaxID=75366 RepID=A0A672K0K1_SINGR